MGFKLSRRGGKGKEVSHLLFLDDALFLFDRYKKKKKSELISMGNIPNQKDLVVELLCRKGKLPTMYLGLPL